MYIYRYMYEIATTITSRKAAQVQMSQTFLANAQNIVYSIEIMNPLMCP